jgi:DNA repair protein RadC
MEKEIMKPEWYQVAEVELVYRSKVKPSQRPKVVTSEDAYKILKQVWDTDKIELVEEFKVLLLNRGNKVLGVFDASSGGTTGTVADPRIILAVAIKSNTVNMILAHNHPSGELKPSKADEQLTIKIKEAARYLDIQVLDHIIISKESYYSFADEGNL